MWPTAPGPHRVPAPLLQGIPHPHLPRDFTGYQVVGGEQTGLGFLPGDLGLGGGPLGSEGLLRLGKPPLLALPFKVHSLV